MLIEVRKAPRENQGAQLMLHAVVQRLSPQGHRFCIWERDATEATRAELGLSVLSWMQLFGPFADVAGELATKLGGGRVPPSAVQCVLDTAGFNYGDHWGPAKARISAAYYGRVRARGGIVVLMPQAFGPFEDPALGKHVRTMVDAAQLVFARDDASLQALTGLCGQLPQIRKAPDFTALVRAEPSAVEVPTDAAAIVPNRKMLSALQAHGGTAEDYVAMLARVAAAAARRGLSPYALVHETTDDALAEQLAAQLPMPVVREPHPLRIKWLLSQAHFVMSSRFHALVSALSSGVPSLATGWSHKYEHLLGDYGCPECLLSPTATEEDIEARVELLLGAERLAFVERLRASAQAQRQQSERMWLQVESLLEG